MVNAEVRAGAIPVAPPHVPEKVVSRESLLSGNTENGHMSKKSWKLGEVSRKDHVSSNDKLGLRPLPTS